MTGLIRRLLRIACAIGILAPGTALAEISCPQGICSPPVIGLQKAGACLCASSGFADTSWGTFLAGSESFQDVLLPQYEGQPGYSDSGLQEAIDAAVAASPTTLAEAQLRDEIIFEASFRKASAHGMFGDYNLIRALNASYTVYGESARESLGYLDSRVCTTASDPPGGSRSFCGSMADCSGGEVCRAILLGGAYGAIQEYRRGETSLVVAMRELGDRFRELDSAQNDAAASLLLRLGALKSRAHAERVERLAGKAVASGGVQEDAPRCVQAGNPVPGATCGVDRDCGAGWRCGESAGERARVALDEAAHEALTEASIAQAFYASRLPETLLSSSIDLASQRTALGSIRQSLERSERNLTPFGLPSDYVPFLGSVQADYMNCLEGCPPGTSCEQTSIFECLMRFADSGDYLDLLGRAATAQEQASLDAQSLADSVRNAQQTELDVKNQFRNVLLRLFGESCVGACGCTDGDILNGRCVRFDNEVWLIQGVECQAPAGSSAPPDPTGCSTELADGEIERQLQSIQNAGLAVANIQAQMARNDDTAEFTRSQFGDRLGISDETCGEIEYQIEHFGNEASTAIEESRSGFDFGKFIGGAAQVAAGAVAAYFSAGQVGLGWAMGGIEQMGGSVIDELNDDNKPLELQRKLAELRLEKELAIQRAQCKLQQRMIEIDQDDALWDVETQRLALEAQQAEQVGRAIESLIVLNQLFVEGRRARDLYDETVRMGEIWQDAGFRNPQNYRALALKNQLEAGEAFRTAQIVTWMILRSAAYDLARPDFNAPQSHAPADVLRIDSCRQSECKVCPPGGCQTGGTWTGNSCATVSDCGLGESCQLTDSDASMADSDGSCSLQAVFAARSVDDLRHLIRSAYFEQVVTYRTLACQGDCTKTVKLRNLFTDPSLGAAQPNLGSVLVSGPLTQDGAAVIEFEISLARGVRLCPRLPDGQAICHPNGVASLYSDNILGLGSGPGDNASIDAWNARILDVAATVLYEQNRRPDQAYCRNPADGRVVDPWFYCSGGTVECGDGCKDLLGADVACRCDAILDGRPEVELLQLGPGVVRTPLADPNALPGGEDSFLRYRMRIGDLFPAPGESPKLKYFGSPLTLYSQGETALASENFKGVPVASPRWQLRIKSDPNQATIAHYSEFLESIEDIELTIRYQAFDLTGL